MVARNRILALTLGALLAACVDSTTPSTGGDAGPHDGGTDGGVLDAGTDGGSSDAGTDGGSPPGSPGAPTLTATSTISPGSVQLAWTAADALATHFEVLRSINQGAFTQLAQVSGSTLAYTDSAPEAGFPSAYKVTASDAAGTGAASNEIDVLASPFDVAAAGSDTKMIVTWSPIDNADTYDVYRVPASGAAQLLGNTASNNDLDDGSVLPVVTGASYAYRVVAKSAAGYVASIGSNVATTTAVGLDVTANQIFISDTSEEPQNLAPSLSLEARNVDGGPLLDDAGAPVVFESVSNGSVIVVPGVPRGTYAITVEGYHDYAVGSARALDFSQATMGRSTAMAAASGTQIAYNLTGLAAWAALDAGIPDALEEISVGAGDYAANLAYDVTTAPAAGATTFAGTETLGGDTDLNLISVSSGDAFYLFQLHAKTSSNGIGYLAPSGLFPTHAITTVNGAGNSIAGALAAPSAIAIAGFDFPRSAYLDPAHATLNPAATNPAQRVYLEVEKGFAAHGWYSNQSLADGLILDVPQDGGTTEADGGIDVNVGAVSWANPAAAAWDSFALVQSTYDVPFTISFQDTSTTPSTTASASTTFTAYSSATVPMSGTTFVNSALSPTLSAPRAPLINGASAFTASTGQSSTSILSWTAPALGVPVYYLVVIYAIVPEMNDDGSFVMDGNGNYLVDIDETASFTTKSTSVSLAGDLVLPGVSYFATLDAVSNASGTGAIDATVTPYTLGENYASAETVTALFTVASPGGASRAEVLRPRRWTRPAALGKGGRLPKLPTSSG